MSSLRDHANEHAHNASEHDRLREQIAEAIWSSKASGPSHEWEQVLNWSRLAGYRADTFQRADAVMAVVQPALDREWRRALEATIRLDMVRELVQMPHNASDHLSSRVLSVLDMPVPEET